MDLRKSTLQMKPGKYNDGLNAFPIPKDDHRSMDMKYKDQYLSHVMNDNYDESKDRISVKEERDEDYSIKPHHSKSKDISVPHTRRKQFGRSNSSQKKMRRSKKDQEGRNFRCDYCEKTYLSYPALYTHKKLKHNDKGSESSHAPKKMMKPSKPYDPNKNPTCLSFWAVPERSGGPIDPLTSFYDVVTNNLEMDPKSFRLYSFLKVFSILDGYASEDPHTLIPKRDYDCLTEKDKVRFMSCDEVMCLYLREISRFTNAETYKKVMKFIILYRQCINQFGNKIRNEPNSYEYSICNSAEFMPDFCNEFIVEFVEKRNRTYGLSKDELLDYTRNFCMWLFTNGFTCTRISMRS